MAGMAGKDVESMRRIVASVASHLMPASHFNPSHDSAIGFSGCSSSMDDSYHKKHGEVPTHEPIWRLIASDESGKEFTDIIYEKAVGEGIAKVCSKNHHQVAAFVL